MATLSRGQTFGATETITNTKLHALVDSGSVTGITNADCDNAMALANSKLAAITDSSKVSGTSLYGLASIPSGAGVIPPSNVSLVSIPNSSLLPITTASYVSGYSFFNLTSMVSLAANAIPLGPLTNSLFSSILDYGTSASASTSRSQSSLKLCYGNVAVSGSSSVALSNLPFSSSSSYTLVACFGQNQSATEALEVVQSSGSAATIYNNDNAAQTARWFAVGT